MAEDPFTKPIFIYKPMVKPGMTTPMRKTYNVNSLTSTGEEHWARGVKGVLLDITGVLYESGRGSIPGSIEAVDRLKEAGIPVRFCTNETTTTRKSLAEMLQRMGFNLKEEEVFPPIPALCHILTSRGLRPHLLVHPNSLADFSEVDTNNPNCVVLGDAGDSFSYANMNHAFQLLMSLEKPILFSLGKGRYYKDGAQLVLDVGPFAHALEFSCGIQAEVVGKPSSIFFRTTLQDMGLRPDQVVMVGDDVVSDVGGAQATGMKGILVRTGKYRPQDESHPDVKPNAVVNNLDEAVGILLSKKDL